MAEREDNVYKAKLAEQAERYDGEEHNRKSDNRKNVSNFFGRGLTLFEVCPDSKFMYYPPD